MGTARGHPMQSYRAEGYGRMSLLFLTHYIRYYGIKPADDLRVVLLRQRKPSQDRGGLSYPEVDSSSWYEVRPRRNYETQQCTGRATI
jgi:hypothetical protein